MKKCPFCAEEIQNEAILCKHCHSDLKMNKPVLTENMAPKRIFKYHTKDANGANKVGEIEASDEKVAVKELQKQGLFVISIEPKMIEEEHKNEVVKICPYCKETYRKGATVCSHCRENLFFLEYPNISTGVIFGAFIGAAIIWYKIHSSGHYDFDILLEALVKGYFYPIIGGIVGGILACILDGIDTKYNITKKSKERED